MRACCAGAPTSLRRLRRSSRRRRCLAPPPAATSGSAPPARALRRLCAARGSACRLRRSQTPTPRAAPHPPTVRRRRATAPARCSCRAPRPCARVARKSRWPFCRSGRRPVPRRTRQCARRPPRATPAAASPALPRGLAATPWSSWRAGRGIGGRSSSHALRGRSCARPAPPIARCSGQTSGSSSDAAWPTRRCRRPRPRTRSHSARPRSGRCRSR
mmetsp:Transcript_127950/g.358190  ORF Transcript_127950/g.358190 Transcript_127950/m.358190 type:complete len:216 (+) Transcript_127950:334-981(+)